MDLYKIPGVEIFSAGTWNGDEYSEADLDEMVRAFEENKGAVRPFLKLGHDEDQKLLQSNGLPAAGWIERIYRVGEKLVADFVDIPKVIYELIERKAYRKVSSEIYWNIDIGEKSYSRMLGAVALLGSELPGVMNLSDIMSWYSLTPKFATMKIYNEENKQTMKVHEFTNPFKEEKMDKKEETQEVDALVEAKLAHANELAEMQKKLDAMAEEKQAAEAKAKDYELTAQKAALEASVDALLMKNIITPAMKPYMIALLGDEKKEYSFGEKDKEKKLTKFEMVEEILKLHAATDVNTEESSVTGESVGAKSVDVLNEKIEKYAAEHKVGYRDAYKSVMRESVSTEAE